MSMRSAGRLSVRRADLREAVLSRVVGALGAQADLPLDRVSDAQLVGATLVATAARRSPGGTLEVDLHVGPGAIELCLGPLPRGTARAIVSDSALPGVGAVLERLVDGWAVEELDERSENLRLTIGAETAAAR